MKRKLKDNYENNKLTLEQAYKMIKLLKKDLLVGKEYSRVCLSCDFLLERDDSEVCKDCEKSCFSRCSICTKIFSVIRIKSNYSFRFGKKLYCLHCCENEKFPIISFLKKKEVSKNVIFKGKNIFGKINVILLRKELDFPLRKSRFFYKEFPFKISKYYDYFYSKKTIEEILKEVFYCLLLLYRLRKGFLKLPRVLANLIFNFFIKF